MTAPMVAWEPPDGVEVLIQWLKELGETRDDRPTGAVLPYRMVERDAGPYDGLVDKGVYTVHTFGLTKPEARDEAWKTHRRMEYLVGRFSGQQRVTISDGKEVLADNVETVDFPHHVQWVADDSFYRYVATYRVDLRIQPVLI